MLRYMKFAVLTVLIVQGSTSIARTRPKTLVSCVSPQKLDVNLEVFIEPPPKDSASAGWVTVIEVTNSEDVFVEEKNIKTIYDQLGDLYVGSRLQFRLTMLNSGLLYGKLSDQQDKLPTIFHCQKLR